uniref:Putative secreted protein n=1 Tax=Ixodes ricinus TaxID=34613 RepID=A0A6B0UTE7_IXORI
MPRGSFARLEISKATGAPRSVLLSVAVLGEGHAESPWVQRGSASVTLFAAHPDSGASALVRDCGESSWRRVVVKEWNRFGALTLRGGPPAVLPSVGQLPWWSFCVARSVNGAETRLRADVCEGWHVEALLSVLCLSLSRDT